MDCSLPGFSVHRILQARILEWVAISFSRGGNLIGKEIQKRETICIGTADSLPCSAETNKALQNNYTSIQFFFLRV